LGSGRNIGGEREKFQRIWDIIFLSGQLGQAQNVIDGNLEKNLLTNFGEFLFALSACVSHTLSAFLIFPLFK
jgi:hypothetical protein